MANSKIEQIKSTSIRLPDGGDTHVHTNPDRTVTITTRMPSGFEDHVRFDKDGNRIS